MISPRAPLVLADYLAAAVAVQERGGDDPAALLGDQHGALLHPRVDDELLRLPLELGEHALTGTATPGTIAWTCALTSAVTCSRSPRLNGRTSTDTTTSRFRATTRLDRGRYRCGTGRC